MSCSDLIYVVSMSLQLSGAVLLLIHFWGVNIEKGIEINKEIGTHVDEEQSIAVLGPTTPPPYEYAKSVWLNRFAFLNISFGYLVAVFGEIDCKNKCCIVICIFVFSSSLVALSCFISHRLSVRYK